MNDKQISSSNAGEEGIPVSRVGVQCFVFQDNKILLGQRKNIFGHGTWGLPGGHLEEGETILEAAARELSEETGLTVHKMKIAAISEGVAESNYHLQIGVFVEEWTGTPQIREPNACSALAFFDFSDLPNPIFIACVGLIRKYRLGVLY